MDQTLYILVTDNRTVSAAAGSWVHRTKFISFTGWLWVICAGWIQQYDVVENEHEMRNWKRQAAW